MHLQVLSFPNLPSFPVASEEELRPASDASRKYPYERRSIMSFDDFDEFNVGLTPTDAELPSEQLAAVASATATTTARRAFASGAGITTAASAFLSDETASPGQTIANVQRLPAATSALHRHNPHHYQPRHDESFGESPGGILSSCAASLSFGRSSSFGQLLHAIPSQRRPSSIEEQQTSSGTAESREKLELDSILDNMLEIESFSALQSHQQQQQQISVATNYASAAAVGPIEAYHQQQQHRQRGQQAVAATRRTSHVDSTLAESSAVFEMSEGNEPLMAMGNVTFPATAQWSEGPQAAAYHQRGRHEMNKASCLETASEHKPLPLLQYFGHSPSAASSKFPYRSNGTSGSSVIVSARPTLANAPQESPQQFQHPHQSHHQRQHSFSGSSVASSTEISTAHASGHSSPLSQQTERPLYEMATYQQTLISGGQDDEARKLAAGQPLAFSRRQAPQHQEPSRDTSSKYSRMTSLDESVTDHSAAYETGLQGCALSGEVSKHHFSVLQTQSGQQESQQSPLNLANQPFLSASVMPNFCTSGTIQFSESFAHQSSFSVLQPQKLPTIDTSPSSHASFADLPSACGQPRSSDHHFATPPYFLQDPMQQFPLHHFYSHPHRSYLHHPMFAGQRLAPSFPAHLMPSSLQAMSLSMEAARGRVHRAYSFPEVEPPNVLSHQRKSPLGVSHSLPTFADSPVTMETDDAFHLAPPHIKTPSPQHSMSPVSPVVKSSGSFGSIMAYTMRDEAGTSGGSYFAGKLHQKHSPSTPQLVHHYQACAVCGDHASCQHYGVRTCEGCKGFFKRTVQKNAKYQCLQEQKCPIDKPRRNRCQYCRYQKCLSVGMVKEVVRTDSLKGRRGRLPSKPKAHQASDEVSSSPPATLSVSLLRAFAETHPEKQNWDYSLVLSCEIIPEEQILSLLAKSIEIHRIWAEKIPGFADLDDSDQDELLKASFFATVALKMAHKSYANSLIAEGKLVFCNGTVISVGQTAAGLWQDWLGRVLKLASDFHEMELDTSAFSCLAALSLLHTRDENRICQKDASDNLYSCVINALKEHCSYNVEAQRKQQYCATILAKLADLQFFSRRATEALIARKNLGFALPDILRRIVLP